MPTSFKTWSVAGALVNSVNNSVINTFRYQNRLLDIGPSPFPNVGNFRDPTRFWYDVIQIDRPIGSSSWYSNTGALVAHWTGPINVDPPYKDNAWVVEAYDRVYSRAYDDWCEQLRGDLDVSVDLAQAKMSSLLVGNAKRLTAGYMVMVEEYLRVKKIQKEINQRPLSRRSRRLRKKILGGKLPLLRDLIHCSATARLAWVYDVKPTLESIHGAITHVSNHYFNVGFDVESDPAINDVVQITDGAWTGWSAHTVSTYLIYYKYYCRIKGHFVVPDDGITNAARLSSLNPVSIGWELMPYSFVVDWFYDIGSYLRRLETRVIYGSYFTKGELSYCNHGNGSIYGMYDSSDPAVFPGSYWSYTTNWKRWRLNRQVLTSMPNPTRPQFYCRLGSGRLLNAAALLTNFLGKRGLGRQISHIL